MNGFTMLFVAAVFLWCRGLAAAAQGKTPALLPYINDFRGPPGGPVLAGTRFLYFVAEDGIFGYDRLHRTTFVIDSGIATDLAVSRKGDQLAFAAGEQLMSIWTLRLDPVTGHARSPRRRLSVRSGRAPAFSPDGRWVAFSGLPADTLITPRVIRVPATGGPEEVLTREPGFAQTLRWSSDGQWVYYRHGKTTPSGRLRTLHRVRSSGGESEQLVRIGEFVGVSPDGRVAYVTNEHYHLNTEPKHVVIGDRRGAPLREFSLPADAMPVAWGPGEEQLLVQRPVGRGLTSIHVADLNLRIRELMPAAFDNQIAGHTGDGHLLLHATFGDRRELVSVDAATGDRRVLFSTVASNGTISWLGQNYVAVLETDSAMRVVNLTTQRERRLHRRQCPVRLSPVRADRTLLCVRTTSGARELLLVNVETGKTKSLRTLAVAEQDRPALWLVSDTLLVLSLGPRIVTASVNGGALKTLFTIPANEVASDGTFAISRDGLWLGYFFASADRAEAPGFLRLVSLTTGATRIIRVPDLPTLHVASTQWDPQGRFVTVGVDNGARVDVWAVPLNGEHAFSLTRAEPNGSGDFMLAADGNSVFYTTQPTANASATSLWTVELSRRTSMTAKR